MLYDSHVVKGGAVPFPSFEGDRHYMVPFFKNKALPSSMSRWQDTVDAMLVGVDTDRVIYLMIDQAEVTKGSYHRRPGLHIDGYWNGTVGKWDPKPDWGSEQLSGHGSGHVPEPAPSGHGGGHGSSTDEQFRRHTGRPLTKKERDLNKKASEAVSTWSTSPFLAKEAIILASDVSASRAFDTMFIGPIGDGGDCSHIVPLRVDPVLMHGNRAYLGNVTMLHETLPAPYDCQRTVVRLNVPGWHPN